jgi:hypothetical protein
MAGPRTNDPYNPTPSVTPQTGSPFNYDTSQASGNDFGAQVGAAVDKLGQVGEAAAKRQFDVSLQHQGMLNETMATNAETEASAQYGAINGSYQSMQGLEAVAALPGYIDKIKQVRQNLRETLPNAAAQRAFDQLALRREGFALENANSHAATQIKAAEVKSSSASLNMSVDSLSDPTVALNSAQSDDALANVKFQVARVLQSQGYGFDSGSGMKMDGKGNLSFDEDTPQGKQAKAVADQYTQEAIGKAWENRIKTVAFDPNRGNVKTAVDMLDQNKDEIPSAVYARLSASLDGPYKNVQSRDIANQALYEADQTYNGKFSDTSSDVHQGPTEESVQGIIKSIVPGVIVTSGLRTPEHNQEVGGVPNSQHLSGKAVDIVLPQGTSFQDFKTGLLQKGVKPTELIDEGDHIHIAWGSKGSSGTGKGYLSQADYYRMNYDDIVQSARSKAEEQHPDDPAFADQVEARTTQRINNVIRTQELSVRADQNTILQSINNSSAPITSVDQLQNSPDPKVRQAWDNVQLNSPYAASAIQNRLLTANSKGQASGYGTDFSRHLFDALSGKVQSYSDFLPYVRADHNSPVTNTGLGQLNDTLKMMGTEQGRSFAKSEMDFLNQMKSGFTSTIPGVNTPKLNEQFEKSVQTILPRIQAGMSAGKSASDLFDPKSSDFVGKDVKYPTKAEIIKAQSDALMSGPVKAPVTGMNYSDLNSLKEAVQKDPSLRKQAEQYALQKGWIRENPPAVPNSFNSP